ncbi:MULTISPECIES: hypothetical protein [Microcystis]|uniref:hypothetical protein n=1 Tax=Microcystis TaxID=1125 RepID=UPI001680B98B|nr:hypothetical protein [Microcystis wesenbergii]MBD2116182.1 hypothetical protein [Microcystis wesenbergii FACHB-1339]
MTPEQTKQYQAFRSADTPGIERVKAMDSLQKQGFILELPEVVEAINAAIMEGKANEQCN